jgi:hypothetical protein
VVAAAAVAAAEVSQPVAVERVVAAPEAACASSSSPQTQ